MSALTVATACGRKADPAPAELVRPRAIVDLAAKPSPEGVELDWSRPRAYVNGGRLDDLGGFLVFRGAPGAQAEQIGTVAVVDRDRFRTEKKYSFLDGKAEKGKIYYYRIVSYTTDRYYSAPSNQVTVTLPQ